MDDLPDTLSGRHVTRCVEQMLSAVIAPGHSVAIAYSGGIDSTVLLHATNAYCAARSISMTAVHINHAISPLAQAWDVHCRRYCQQLGVRYDSQRVYIPAESKLGPEAAARNERHLVLKNRPETWILLGHHQQDLVESVFLNLLRGAGTLGLAAMRPRSGNYLRPLLHLDRDALLAYARRHDLAWIEDESNNDLQFARNFLRHEILPNLFGRYPGGATAIAQAAEHAAEAQALLQELAEIDNKGSDLRCFPLPLATLVHLSDKRRANLLRSKLLSLGLQAPPTRRMNEFLRQLRSCRADRHPLLRTTTWQMRVQGRRIHLQVLGES